MPIEKDFMVWFENQDFEDCDEVHSLYHAIDDDDTGYGYEIDWHGDIMFISPICNSDDKLLLTEKSRAAFLNYLDSRYKDEGGIDAARAFEQAMRKND